MVPVLVLVGGRLPRLAHSELVRLMDASSLTRSGTLPTLIALPFGFGMAFVSAETAGIGTLLLIPALVVVNEKSRRRLPSILFALGLGFLAGAIYIMIRTSGVFSQGASPGLVAYAASQLAIGAIILGVGVLLGIRGYGRNDRLSRR